MVRQFCILSTFLAALANTLRRNNFKTLFEFCRDGGGVAAGAAPGHPGRSGSYLELCAAGRRRGQEARLGHKAVRPSPLARLRLLISPQSLG